MHDQSAVRGILAGARRPTPAPRPTEPPVTPIGETVATVGADLPQCRSLSVNVGGEATDLHDCHVLLDDGSVALAVDALTSLGGRFVGVRGAPRGVRLDFTCLSAARTHDRVRLQVTILGTVRAFDPATLDDCSGSTVLAILDLPQVDLWVVRPLDVVVMSDGDVANLPVAEYSRAVRQAPSVADTPRS